MRWALALLLCSAALAGCTAGDDPNPPNADPFPSEPHPAAAGSSTPPSTETHTNPPPGNASTTTTASRAPGAGPFGAHDQEALDSDPAFSGLMYGGRLTGSGAKVRVEATANNAGERTYRVTDGCQPPWSESMQGPSGPVQMREPMGSCAGFRYRDFPAHDFLSQAYEWNGTLWDGAAGRFVPAPAGTYTWTISFDVYSGSGSPPQDHATLTLDFHVTVS